MGRTFEGGWSQNFDDQPLHGAESIRDALAEGRSVVPAEFSRAKQAFADCLWSGAAGRRQRGEDGLLSLARHCDQPLDRVEILGELAASGGRAGSAFDQVAELLDGSTLSAEQLQTVRDSLELSPRERLQLIVDWIGRESKSESEEPIRALPAELVRRPGVTQSARRSEGQSDPPTGPKDLTDPELSEESRLQSALALGDEAVPTLVEMLAGEQKEFARAALLHLGMQSETAQLVYDQTIRLELNPETREAGLSLRRALDDSSSGEPREWKPPIPRSDEHTGWLSRALDRADPENIMAAAVGREVLVIPLALRRLAQIRGGSRPQPSPRPEAPQA